MNETQITRLIPIPLRQLLLGAALIGFALAGAQPAASAERPVTHDALSGAAAKGGPGVRATVSGSPPFGPGSEIGFRFSADREGHLTVVHLNSEGTITVLHPNKAGVPSRVRAGASVSFPPDGTKLTAKMPFGSETLFAFSTERPISRGDLGLSGGDAYAVIDADDAADFAACLERRLAAQGSYEAATLSYRVLEDATRLPYTADSVETYLTTTTRSFQRPTLNLMIHFASGSADLDANARRNLDQVGEALKRDSLALSRFRIAGHTDDVGPADYNKDLSERRALATAGYLSKEHGVDISRLAWIGHGPTKPKINSTSSEARAENRRVELELLRKKPTTRSLGYACGR